MKTKRFAVRIQEGVRAHLKIVSTVGPNEAAVEVIEQLDGEGDRLLGAKISVWEHGTLQKNTSPMFIKSIQPFETTPDIHVVQTMREDARRIRWQATKDLVVKEKERKSHKFEEPYEKWLAKHYDEEVKTFFSLPLESRRECLELREHLKHVTPGQMTEVQARFAGVVSGYTDLYRHEMHAIQENLLATLEMIHHHHAGVTGGPSAEEIETTQRDRLANLIGGENLAGGSI